MFKFKIIEWEKQNKSEPFIHLLFNKTHLLQGYDSALKNQNSTTLIITDAIEQEIIGGISLIKSELHSLQEEIRRLIPTGTSSPSYVWECSILCFSCSQGPTCYASPSEHFSKSFYRCLYAGLVEFGQQKGIGFVVVKLTAEAYPSTKNLGLWPYIIQFFPTEFSDNFFYGILPLKGCFYEKYQKHWEDLERE